MYESDTYLEGYGVYENGARLVGYVYMEKVYT